MCGIAGYFSEIKIIDEMLATIRMRGPDHVGVWQENRVTLGHARLSILDLSERGHQPMLSPSGRYVIVYNGEIYNYKELQLLTDYQGTAQSDTEILLATIDRLGLSDTLPHLVGMFAFALYDRVDQTISLVRDPIGIKPLYYYCQQGSLFFASQIKALMILPNQMHEICSTALSLYFKYNFVPSPYSILKNVFKLPAGTIATYKNGQLVAQKKYWSLQNAVQTPLSWTFEQACDELENILFRSVERQLVADVPVGLFLSGGIDSSLLTALAVRTGKKVATFSIGFHETKYNEAPFARAIATHLGTNHTEEYLAIDQAIQLIDKIPLYCDEPLGDASQIPTWLVSQLAKRHVKVALSGDGGDELFLGYSRYRDLSTLRRMQHIPCISHVMRFFGRSKKLSDQMRFKCYMATEALLHKDIVCQYDKLFNLSPDLLSEQLPQLAPARPSGLSALEYMGYHDLCLYLPDNLLVKIDRCSMDNSLETRVPFLDHPVVEAALKVPQKFKMKGIAQKILLKAILSKYLPTPLFDRPKQGFALPIDLWLRGHLKDWAYSLIEDARQDAYLNISVIERRMDEHTQGKINWQYSLWNFCMWQLWKNHYVKSSNETA
jgi:asparagine synthase (glutamine-hydrolysing)